MRVAVDTGGTFTDLVLDTGEELRLFKSHTTPEDPVAGILGVLELAASDLRLSVDELLGRCETFVHATTRAINALVTDSAARTAFLTTEGHRDILLLREGGNTDPFDQSVAYPEPLVPRSLTFELRERVGADGSIVRALDEQRLTEVTTELRARRVEAVGVALLFSTLNPEHELRVGELLDELLPGVPYTLSHQVNPALREFRRASSACIDASLKPLMTRYFEDLEVRLAEQGFGGRLLIVTSQGGLMDAGAIAGMPIHAINSGPSMAPVAGRHYARRDTTSTTVVIADTGGTTFDVSLVRDGEIPRTRETWIGAEYRGHMTGFPSIDVQSVGAGGGSIAWVDDGGLLRVGPHSAGSVPGPACYGRGGIEPTVTDACVVLGYIDPDYFLGGAMSLVREAAAAALETAVGQPLGLSTEDAAAAVVKLATEGMVHAIEELTVDQGLDPRQATLVGGGGAAGLNIAAIARRLGAKDVLLPDVSAALSAAGALLSDLASETARTLFMRTDAFDFDAVARMNRELRDAGAAFVGDMQGLAASGAARREWAIEARYPHQAWELEVVLPVDGVETPADLADLVAAFHDAHERVFAIADRGSAIEIVTWRLRTTIPLPGTAQRLRPDDAGTDRPSQRRVHFADHGACLADIRRLGGLPDGTVVQGPAILEGPMTTIVVDPGTSCRRTSSGGLLLEVIS